MWLLPGCCVAVSHGFKGYNDSGAPKVRKLQRGTLGRLKDDSQQGQLVGFAKHQVVGRIISDVRLFIAFASCHLQYTNPHSFIACSLLYHYRFASSSKKPTMDLVFEECYTDYSKYGVDTSWASEFQDP